MHWLKSEFSNSSTEKLVVQHSSVPNPVDYLSSPSLTDVLSSLKQSVLKAFKDIVLEMPQKQNQEHVGLQH